jgi:hypothetical protein
MDEEENSAKELRYKCRRHNADYYTDSAIPDKLESGILKTTPECCNPDHDSRPSSIKCKRLMLASLSARLSFIHCLEMS